MLHSASASGDFASTRRRRFAQHRAQRAELRRHLREAASERLAPEQDAATVDVGLHVLGRPVESRGADAEVLGSLDDLAGREIHAGVRERDVSFVVRAPGVVVV
jgi:hypothetical protein